MTKAKTIEIPAPLIEAMKSGSVVLFLGAGSSMQAANASGKKAPSGVQLAHDMSTKFLGKDLSSLGLMQAAEICIGRAGEAKVFN